MICPFFIFLSKEDDLDISAPRWVVIFLAVILVASSVLGTFWLGSTVATSQGPWNWILVAMIVLAFLLFAFILFATWYLTIDHIRPGKKSRQ